MVNGDKDENPYLSIVICSRNDNHGGNMLRRMQVSISGLLEQLEKHRIESELILVDWNPPADKPLLKETHSMAIRFKILYHTRYRSAVQDSSEV